MKSYFFTCGQRHRHALPNGKVWDKDSVLQVVAESKRHAEQKVVDVVGGLWGWACYEKDDISWKYYRNGICAVIFRDRFFSAAAYNLLNRLVVDLKHSLPADERIYDPQDNTALIYNLFKGKYAFSYAQYKEVFEVFIDFANNKKRSQ